MKQSRERRTHTTFNDISDAVEEENKKTTLWFAHKVNRKVTIAGEKV